MTDLRTDFLWDKIHKYIMWQNSALLSKVFLKLLVITNVYRAEIFLKQLFCIDHLPGFVVLKK